MTLPEASVRRPVATVAAALLTTVAGLIALTALPIREYPAIDPPTLSVTTSYAGAAAEVVETQITEPLEAAINTVGGITTLRSSSREGVSQITVEFSLDTDLDAAASDVRDQVARTARRLPPDVEPPILNKADADSQPILGLALRSERRSQLELGEFANDLKERLQTVPGVAEVSQPAEKRYAMRLWIDADKLRAYDLTPLDVRAAVERENVELPSGRIEGQAVELAGEDAVAARRRRAEFGELVDQRHRRPRRALLGHRLRDARRAERAGLAEGRRHADRGPLLPAASRRESNRDRGRDQGAARRPEPATFRPTSKSPSRTTTPSTCAVRCSRSPRRSSSRSCSWCWSCSRSYASGGRR